MFKKVFLILVFIVGLSNTGWGEEISDEKQRLIKDLLEVTNTLDLFENMKTASIEQFEKNVVSQGIQLTPAQIEAAKGVLGEVFDEKRTDLFLMLVNIYDQNYSESELQQLLDFYETDMGKMFIEKIPAISNQVLVETNRLVIEMQPLIQSKMSEAFQALEDPNSES